MTMPASSVSTVPAGAVLTTPMLERPGLRHGWFTRQGGVSEGIYASLNGGLGSADQRAAVIENRRRMATHMGVAEDCLLSLHQVHSAEVVVATGPWTGERPRADALVSATPGLALAIATADCGPILFADPVAGVIGAAHAGWKGAHGGIVEATVAAMERLGARRGQIEAALGPTISQAAYEVGPEFVSRFGAADQGHFTPSPRAGHALFDLPGYIAARMAEAGIARFVDLRCCTYADPARFYSYRRSTHLAEPDYGRLIAAIALM